MRLRYFAVSFVVLLLVGYACPALGAERVQELELGADAPDFSLPGVDDETHSLGDFEDKEVLVVIFHCNHCPAAIAWQGRMVQIQADYAEKGVQLVAINPNCSEQYPADSFENMKKRAEEENYNFPYLRDRSQDVARAYGARVTPHVFMFDGERKLRFRGAIDDNMRNPDAVETHHLRDAIDAVLAGEEVENPSVRAVGCTVKWKRN